MYTQHLSRTALVFAIVLATFVVGSTFAFADTVDATTTASTTAAQTENTSSSAQTMFGNWYSTSSPNGMQDFRATLNPNNEVPPVTSSTTGDIALHSDGNSLSYVLRVFNGNDITDAHLHCGMQGQNGPVVVSLFDADASSSVDVNGNLSSGTITSGSIATTSAGCENVLDYQVQTLNDLRRAIQNEDIYANVHSVQYPNGTSRGQLTMISTSTNNNGNGSGDYGSGTSTDDGHHGSWWQSDDHGNGSDESDHEHDSWNNADSNDSQDSSDDSSWKSYNQDDASTWNSENSDSENCDDGNTSDTWDDSQGDGEDDS